MNFLIIIPPYVIKRGKGVTPNKAMVPTGPLMMATLLREGGHEVIVKDLTFTPNWQEEILGLQKPDVVLLSCHTVRNIESCKAVLICLNEAWNKLPYSVLGGNSCLELGTGDFRKRGIEVDAVVRGFGHDDSIIDGIISKTPGDLSSTCISPSLPLPSLDLLDAPTHKSYLRASDGKYPIYGHGIGCKWRCKYCSANMATGWQARSTKEVEIEVEMAVQYGYNHLWCVDNLLLLDEQTAGFDRIARKHKMTWSGMTRSEIVVKNASIFAKLNALTEMALGVEAVEEKTLSDLRRGRLKSYTRTVRDAFGVLEQANVKSTAFIILDLPETADAQFWNLLEFLNELRPSSVSWAFYVPPAEEADPKQHGFYNWPLGMSKLSAKKVVQQAMVISAVYWLGWQLESYRPFFTNGNSFGIRCKEGNIFQQKDTKSPIGDIWEVWYQNERRRK